MILAPFCVLRVAGQQVEQRRVTSAREEIDAVAVRLVPG